MLIKLRFHFPEVLLGILLAVAIFAMGMLFASSTSFSIQNSAPHQTSDQQTSNKAGEDGGKTQSLWIPTDSVGLYTLVLSFFTALLVGVSSIQGYFLLRADRTARIAAIAARDTALKTAEMAQIADRQLAIIGHQTDIQQKQHAVGRLQFIAEKRPILRVRHVRIDHPTPATQSRTPLFQNHTTITGSLVIVNTGGTEARITDSRHRIFWTNVGLPMTAPLYELGKSLPMHRPQDHPIAAGASINFKIEGTEQLPGIADSIMKGNGNWKLFILGYVRYADLGENERFMGFCREYCLPSHAGGEGRFRPVDDPDYEYSD